MAEKFRQHHEQLHTVIKRVLQSGNQGEQVRCSEPSVVQIAYQLASGHLLQVVLDPEDTFAVSEVASAYDAVCAVDPLELSEAGTNAWKAAIESYEERISRVESRIATRMRDQLGTATTADDMFRIFSRFTVLFNRPRRDFLRHGLIYMKKKKKG